MFKDQLGHTVCLNGTPQRIVSLVPSQTELLYHLGLGERVVGITKFCIHPEEWYRSKTRIGGPKKLNIDKIIELQPDLIIGNKEENIKEEVEALQQVAPVWISDVFNLEDALSMISSISEMCEKVTEGNVLIQQIKSNFSTLKPLRKAPKVGYFIWRDPYLVVGGGNFIHHILTEQLGFENAFGKIERYPVLDRNNLPDLDYVFLSTEPYPFNIKHIPEIQHIFPKAKILVVDGEYFTWYGSRLVGSPAYFTSLFERMG